MSSNNFNFELQATSFESYDFITRGCWRNQYHEIVVATLHFFAQEDKFPYEIEGVPSDDRSTIASLIIKNTKSNEYIEVAYPRIEDSMFLFYTALFMQNLDKRKPTKLVVRGTYFKVIFVHPHDGVNDIIFEGRFKNLKAIDVKDKLDAMPEILNAHFASDEEYGPKEIIGWFTKELQITNDELVDFRLSDHLTIKDGQIVSATLRKPEYLVVLDENNNLKFITDDFTLIQRSFPQEYVLNYTQHGDVDANTLANFVKEGKLQMVSLLQDVAEYNKM
jgi:hypothetical protein